jgi:hypothetical protein
MYGQYVFTDVSSGFMAAAMEKFSHEQCMEYKVLDITLDPVEQGFDPHSFDLIIASNVSVWLECLVPTALNSPSPPGSPCHPQSSILTPSCAFSSKAHRALLTA